MTRSLLLATHNQGKLIELRQLLSSLSFDFQSLRDFSSVEIIEETGDTFEANATLKAAGYARQTGIMTLADDSGLEVAALAGAPGVQSARYAGEDATDRQRIKKLLAELSNRDTNNRTARFVAVIAIADAGGRVLYQTRGTCEGEIAFEPRGSSGFGYDPIFLPCGYEQSFGELEAEVKNVISHRARAVAQARDFLGGFQSGS